MDPNKDKQETQQQQQAQDQAPTEGTSAPTEAEIERARDLLGQAGMYVLPGEAIKGIKERAASEAAREAAEAKARLEQLEAQLAEIQGARPEGDPQSDDAKRILEERQAEWERRQAEAARRIEQLEADLRAKETALRERVVDSALGRILTNAADLELATMWAKAKIGKISATETGDLLVEDRAGIQFTGQEAERVIRKWWESQKILHAAPPPGPPTGSQAAMAAPAAPGGIQHPGEYAPPRDAPLSARLEYAQRYQEQLQRWKEATGESGG